MAKKKKKSSKAKKRRQRRIIGITVFLVILAVAIFAIVRFMPVLLPGRVATANPVSAIYGNTHRGTLVVARTENTRETESNTTIEFVAVEGSKLNRSDVICKVYSSGYNQTEITRLQTYRDSIESYHLNQVFSAYVDAALDNENSTIAALARQVRTLVQSKSEGSLSNLERQLNSELSARRSYLKAKYPDDQTLSELYKVENDQLKKIESWTTTYAATEECLVSFYTDGYENMVNSTTYNALTPDDVRNVIRGVLPTQSVVARGNKAIYRTVNPNEWYALFLCQEKDWNPEIGGDFTIAMDGFDDYVVTGVLETSNRIGNDLLLKLKVSADVTPILNMRVMNATVGNYTSGYYVPNDAIRYLDGYGYGVMVQDGNNQVFVQVNIISGVGDNTFVRPVIDGAPFDETKTILIQN